MLNAIELEMYFAKLGTPIAGRQFVMKARRESPVRKVQSRIGNVITKYQSRKMGVTVDVESRTVEFPALINYEFDSQVLEYYAQPAKLDIIATDGGLKKPYRLQHTPDFLLLYSDKIVIDEWREEVRLQKLAGKYPGRYEYEEGKWRMPEVEAQLREMGIHYQIRTPDEHPQQFIRNIQFLADYLTVDFPPVEVDTLASIRLCFVEHAFISIADLIATGRAAQISIIEDVAQ
jgi:putative transposase